MSKPTSTGNYSTGDRSTGDWSTGYSSTGYSSTGHRSTGYSSTGDWSISNHSTGHFSTEDFSGFGCFDKPCTLEEWQEADKPNCLYFDLTEWVEDESKTDGGYLKGYDYKEAFTASMEKASKEEIEQIKALPNFDADKFYQISGFRIKDTKTINLGGEDIEISIESFEAIRASLLK